MIDFESQVPVPDPQSPQALQAAKQEYLIEQALKGALRHLYGDTAVHTTARIAKHLAHELVARGVTIVSLWLTCSRAGVA